MDVYQASWQGEVSVHMHLTLRLRGYRQSVEFDMLTNATL